jgi:hypothetical protein
MATHHSMPDSRSIQGCGYTARSFSHGIHGGDHPFPGEVVELDGGHTKYSRSILSLAKPATTGLAEPVFDCRSVVELHHIFAADYGIVKLDRADWQTTGGQWLVVTARRIDYTRMEMPDRDLA